ncbi:MAG: hypothetical protein SF051_00720 [Elusimicrobiota bacterium]|nr:hypothetical protein [Elusimicrobiota bacterium]
MVLALVLAAAASAAPAAPSFDAALLDVRRAVHLTRAAAAADKDAALASRLDRAAWDVQRHERDASSLRRELSMLKSRLSRYGAPRRGQPDSDPGLRWEVQRTGRDLQDHARALQWTLHEVRAIRQAITDKAPELVAPAGRLESQMRWLVSEERWVENEGRWFGFDLRRAGFHFEAFDYERAFRDAADRVRELEDETRQILAKVR